MVLSNESLHNRFTCGFHYKNDIVGFDASFNIVPNIGKRLAKRIKLVLIFPFFHSLRAWLDFVLMFVMCIFLSIVIDCKSNSYRFRTPHNYFGNNLHNRIKLYVNFLSNILLTIHKNCVIKRTKKT